MESEAEQVDGFVRSHARETRAAQREAQPFVDEGREALILKRDEGPDSQFRHDGVRFSRIPADEMGQRNGLGHPDRVGGQEPLEG